MLLKTTTTTALLRDMRQEKIGFDVWAFAVVIKL